MVTAEDLKKISEEIIANDPNRKPIYQIMLFEFCTTDHIQFKRDGTPPVEFPYLGDTYFVGFYHDLDTTIEVLTRNRTDLHEGCYNHAFILLKTPGVYVEAGYKYRMYFEYDPDTQQYVQKEEPDILSVMAY